MIERLCRDPYRLFFPLGAMSLLYGLILWMLYGLFEFGDFPYEKHIMLFLGGYLSFSVIGFLLTAIPRFTSTDFLTKNELFLFALAILFSIVTFLIDKIGFFWGTIHILFFLLIVFAAKRFSERKNNPPYTFIFVGLGVILGALGSLIMSLSYISPAEFHSLEKFGTIIFYDYTVFSLILGVGGRLIPGILGFSEVVNRQRNIYEKNAPFFKMIPTRIWLSLFFLITAIILELKGFERYSWSIKAFLVTFFSIKYWQLYKKPKLLKWHRQILRLSCFFLVLGSWVLCFSNQYTTHLKHMIYIGCYSLLTLMVASRVIIAHSNESLDYEYRKYPYLFVGALIAIASFTRILAPFIEDSYLPHLGYSALLFGAAVIIWILSFFRFTLAK